MNNLDNVIVGDTVVYATRVSTRLITVTRVTKTQIICGSNKFNKETGNLIRAKNKYNWLDNPHIYLPTHKQLEELRVNKLRKKLINDIEEVDLQHIAINVLANVYELLCNGSSNYDKRIDELESEVTEVEEKNDELRDQVRNLEYELQERNTNHSYLIKQLIQLARNNITPYSQQDNDVWGIQQEIEKIIGVDLND
jgi:uncharacterized coiled-coil protein SlyX